MNEENVIVRELEKRSSFFKGNRFIPKNLADYIMSKNTFKTAKDNEQIYIYEDGVYKPDGEAVIKEEVYNTLGELAKKNHVNEVISYIQGTTFIDRKEFNSDKNKIPLENGVLNLNTMDVEDFSSNPCFTFKIPVTYDPNAKCEKFLNWLHEALKSDREGEEKWKTNVIQEYSGYGLLKDNRFQKALLLFGERRTGKSTLLKVLEQLLGKNNCKNYTLQFLNEDKFALAYLFDKIANIVADLPSQALITYGIFMQITGNDTMTSAFKHGHSFEFEPSVKLIFSCNEIPAIYNKIMAFYRRWLLIEFKNLIPEEKVNPDFEEPSKSPLMTKEELSGIFNWALEGLKRLLEQGKFSYPYDEFKVKDMYERASDSVSSYVLNCIEEDDYNKELKRDVYRNYSEWCKKEELKIENMIKFGKVFKMVTGCGVSHIDHIPAYSGIKFKDKEVQNTL